MAACLLAGTNLREEREERDASLEWGSSHSATQVLFVEHFWPVKQLPGLVTWSHGGWVHVKSMLAEARAAKAARPKREALMVKDYLERN